MNDYPPDWPCRCGHRADEHQFNVAYQNRICLVRGDDTKDVGDFIVHHVDYKDDCAKFEPIDNLSYFEHVEKQKADALRGVRMK